jgi:hypothetical protein
VKINIFQGNMINFLSLIITSYAVILSLFILVGILNIGDMKIKKRERWVKKDSIAVIIRVLFYGFLISFAIIELEALILMFGSFTLQFFAGKTLHVYFSNSLLISPLLPVIFIGVIYAIAKKREWYELIDEEE